MKLPIVLIFAALTACAPRTQAVEAKPLSQGERAFQKCYSCHDLEPGRNDLNGPSLGAIIGRPVAAEPGFDYSPAMRDFAKREPRWTRSLLDRFAEDPETVVPGTSMMFHGMKDSAERAALIAYLDGN